MMEPATIAAQLRELAIYYELDGDRARTFAYDRAAKSVEAASGLARLFEEGRLEELPHIGPSIARVIGELITTGTIGVLARMRAAWPPVVLELAHLPKVGAAKARAIFQTFAPADLDAVAALCRAGAIRELRGFGKVSEEKLLLAIEERELHGTRMILCDAEDHAASLAHHLRTDPQIARVELAGPIRRWCEIVDRLVYAVVADDRDAVAARLASFALVTSVHRPETGPMVGHLAGGMQAEVYIAPAARFGWAHVVATGATAHVDALRARAVDRAIDLDALAAPDEHAVYAALGLPWLPPEIRDGTDELAAADAGDRFDDLVTLADITVAMHCHTTYSDGRHSIAEMAQAAAELGFGAITITDHSANATYANGLDLARLREQGDEIAHLPDPAVRVLRGTEADILADGTLDVPPEIVGELDVIIASVHQRYKLDEDGTTRRLVDTMRLPYFKIWGHPFGRLVLRRDPIAVRLDDVLDALAEAPSAIEINGDPYRMDPEPAHIRRAAARGIKFVLSSDAHSVRALSAVRYAVALARRARLRKRDVLNTLPPLELAAAVRPGG